MNTETLLSLFTVDNGDIKILLFKKNNEPYKGYWCLPNEILKKDENLDDTITNVVLTKVGLSNIWLEQCFTHGNIDRNYEERTISINYLGLIDSVSLNLKMHDTEYEIEWFKINELPKLAFDHEKVVQKALQLLKTEIKNINIIRILFPSDFSLPELQKVYEDLTEEKYDRRNFRKKLVNQKIIEETGEYTEGVTGRPAKLYRFCDNIKDINIV